MILNYFLNELNSLQKNVSLKHPNEENLIKFIFGDFLNNCSYLIAILCPLNEDTLKINDKIIKLEEGKKCLFKEKEKVTNTYLASNSMPPHVANLKLNAIIKLLRNLNTKRECIESKALFTGATFYVPDFLLM